MTEIRQTPAPQVELLAEAQLKVSLLNSLKEISAALVSSLSGKEDGDAFTGFYVSLLVDGKAEDFHVSPVQFEVSFSKHAESANIRTEIWLWNNPRFIDDPLKDADVAPLPPWKAQLYAHMDLSDPRKSYVNAYVLNVG